MFTKVNSWKVKKTGELLATDMVKHPKFWGRLLCPAEKKKCIANGTLTAEQTEKRESFPAHKEEPLESPDMMTVNDSAGVVVAQNTEPVLEVIEQHPFHRVEDGFMKSNAEPALINAGVFGIEEKKADDSPLTMPPIVLV